MNLPRGKWEISLGNVLTMVGMAAAFFAAWNALHAQSQMNAEKIRTLESLVTVQETRLRQLETEKARLDERLANMLSLLARIDARLERIERAGAGGTP